MLIFILDDKKYDVFKSRYENTVQTFSNNQITFSLSSSKRCGDLSIALWKPYNALDKFATFNSSAATRKLESLSTKRLHPFKLPIIPNWSSLRWLFNSGTNAKWTVGWGITEMFISARNESSTLTGAWSISILTDLLCHFSD